MEYWLSVGRKGVKFDGKGNCYRVFVGKRAFERAKDAVLNLVIKYADAKPVRLLHCAELAYQTTVPSLSGKVKRWEVVRRVVE